MISNALLLSNPLRLSILAKLLDGERGCLELCQALGETRLVINAAIALIEASGMLKARRVGKAVVFSVADEYRGLIGTCRDQASRRAIGKGSER